jgi:putative DNA primase/helicase
MAEPPTGGSRPPGTARPDAGDLVASALDFAARGWPVFPCNPKNKQPLLAAKKDENGKAVRGTGGVSAASTDAAQVRAWWLKWPKAMIGLACGHHRLFVLDFDPRTDDATGEVWTLERLKRELEEQIGCPLPASLAVRTPSDGVHVYLLADMGEAIRNRGNLPDHVDVRGLGGYVIAPPSAMEDGRGYRWLRGAADAAIAEAPAELLAILRASGKGQSPSPRPSPSGGGGSPADPGDAVRKYALAALDAICRAIAGAGSGTRNAALNEGAFGAAQLVAAGALGEGIAKAAVLDAARGNPGRDSDGQIEATFDSGWSAGLLAPRDLSEIGQRQRPGSKPGPRSTTNGQPSSREGGGAASGGETGAGRGRGPADGDLDRRNAFRPQTDLGNLERFLARHGADFLFVEQWGWLAWDGRRWNRDSAVALLGRAVQSTMRSIQDEAAAVKASGWKPGAAPPLLTEEERDDGLDFIAGVKGGKPIAFSAQLAAWGRTSESAGHIGCIAKLAESRLSARVQDFDSDPLVLNVANGALRFQRPAEGRPASVEIRPPDRADRATKLAEVEYRPGEDCPRFDAFLAEVQPEPEMRAFLDCWAGYNALGLADAQKMAVFYGTGSNGKGVWVSSIAHLLGDYAWAAAIETFIDQGRYRKGSDASPDLAALAGRRMVYANEPEENSKFSDGLIKAMTSDEPIGGVRELMKPPFELLVTFTNTVSANHRPKIGTDHGIQRRMQLVPWPVVIPDNRADPQLKAKLRAESSGIFNRLVGGALAYLDAGLPSPQAVVDATREYLEENDLLGQFVAMCIVAAPGETIGATPLHDLFAAWQTWSGNLPQSGKPWSMKHFNAQMQRKDFRIKKSSTMQWQDIAAAFEPGDFATKDDKGQWRAETAELPAPRRVAGPASPIDDDDDELP